MVKFFTKLFVFILCVFYLNAQESQSQDDLMFLEIEDYIYAPNKEKKKSKEYFKSLKELSQVSNDNRTYYYLGMLQKEGIGTTQNFKKSLKSYKKAFELGNKEAGYCIGYYYLKGIGGLEQSYTKAYRWFKKSEIPMAKHWMAKMHFFGLGREVNKAKAIKMLEKNKLYNSRVLVEQFKTKLESKELSERVSSFFKSFPINEVYTFDNINDFPDGQFLDGTWRGEYLELDWSKSKVFRSLPLEMEFKSSNGINNSFETNLKLVDSIASALGQFSAGDLRFTSLEIPIKKEFTDHPTFTHLKTDIRGVELRLVPFENETFLIGRIDASYPVWNEKANPTLVVLQKSTNTNDDAIRAFELQKNDFIKIYPNPFQEQFLVNFNLPAEGAVNIKIHNHYNTPTYSSTVFKGFMKKGVHTMEFDNLPTRQGAYVISIEYNGKIENKVILKK